MERLTVHGLLCLVVVDGFFFYSYMYKQTKSKNQPNTSMIMYV